MTVTAASTEILYIETREEADVDESRSLNEVVGSVQARTRELEEDERIEQDVTPPDDPFGV